MRINRRIKLTNRKDQTVLEEFERLLSDGKEHRKEKKKIAETLKNQGKEVFIEKYLVLNSIRIKPDICYFEDNKWNIVEIEFGGHHQNKIFKNFDTISKLANIKVIDVH